jgi:hypothetical protein
MDYTNKMPKILKKDIINHIEAFFRKQDIQAFFEKHGETPPNIKRAKIDELYKIMEKYNIPSIDEELERKERERIEWEKELEVRERNYKLGQLMKRIINTKLIKDFYKNDKNKFSKWRSYLHMKEIQNYNKYIDKYEDVNQEFIQYNGDIRIELKTIGDEWFLCVKGKNLNSYSLKLHHKLENYGEINEPYKKQEDISNKLNPFKNSI